jgi:hypothetical protein
MHSAQRDEITAFYCTKEILAKSLKRNSFDSVEGDVEQVRMNIGCAHRVISVCDRPNSK